MARGGRTSRLWRGKLLNSKATSAFPFGSPGWTAKLPNTPEARNSPTSRGTFRCPFFQQPGPEKNIQEGRSDKTAWTFPKRGTVGWLHDSDGGFPSNVSFLFLPFHNNFQRTDGSIPASTCSVLRTQSAYLPIQDAHQHRNFAPRTRPINPPAEDIVSFHARTKVHIRLTWSTKWQSRRRQPTDRAGPRELVRHKQAPCRAAWRHIMCNLGS